MYKLRLEKAEEPEIKLPPFIWSQKKQEHSRKKIYLCFIEYAKVFDCWSQNSCGKFFKNWEYQTILLVSWETCMQLTKQQLKSDMEQ